MNVELIDVDGHNFPNSTLEQDLERIYTLRDFGYSPYVMIYDKYKLRKGDDLRRLQRWVNSRFAFAAVKKFEQYRGQAML